MKFSWKGLSLFLLIITLIFLNVMSVFYFVANYFDWKIDTLNINPSDKTTVTSTTYMYPHFAGVAVQENGSFTTDALFDIDIRTAHNGTLAEGAPLYFYAYGVIFPKGQQAIAHIWIGFRGSSHYTFSGAIDYAPISEVSLDAMDYGYPFSLPSSFIFSESTVVKWDVQGDYYPYLQLSFKNGSQLADVDLQVGKVHVGGFNEIQMQNYTRVGTSAAITVVLLGIINIPSIAGLYSKLKKKKTTRRTPKKN